ncbi:radical SAM protein [Okeania sp. SIO2B3]|uniref:radical SAM protein n=1 Tax=Okeania sp. SIO2B3 TaxID=2607784 RepID=UPI0013C1FDE6|nr:radical SAM protein [Okeania sp. SIO2B3]NET46691.1 radical SAM protein [Okeania sp. SIO2B3]
MKSASHQAPTIGLIEVPALGLYDPNGKNWTPMFKRNPLLSKQVLLAHLQAGGFDAQLVHLKDGDYEEEFGQVAWKGSTLTKVYSGKKIWDIDPDAYDAWGVTANFMQEREIVCMVIEHLAKGGKPIVVGGSDAIADPEPYFQAGATVVVLDKSGAANWSIFDSVLGRPPREPLNGVIFPDGTKYPKRNRALNPQDWSLPSLEVARQCFGTEYSGERFLEDLLPIGSIFSDIGCDRTCDFCQTPTYGTGYRRMTPQKALEWLKIQKKAGAKSTVMVADQFLGRILFPGGREEILEIIQGAREMGMPLLWPNGLELRKATLGRGRNYDHSDLTPDEELVEALWGWDGKVGSFLAYVPAERPVVGKQPYAKILPWQQHCNMLRSIVRAGLPVLVYGVIVGLAQDSHEELLYLEESIMELRQDLKSINPDLDFQVASYSISPIPGTPQWDYLTKSGLLRIEDPSVVGEFWAASCDTHHLTYEEVSDWQVRLAEIGKDDSKLLNYHGGLTVVNKGDREKTLAQS